MGRKIKTCCSYTAFDFTHLAESEFRSGCPVSYDQNLDCGARTPIEKGKDLAYVGECKYRRAAHKPVIGFDKFW